jgi:hypothetical protein
MELERKRKEISLLVLIDGYAYPNLMPHSIFTYFL